LDVQTNKVIGMFSMKAVLGQIVSNFSEEDLAKLKENNFEEALKERALAGKTIGELKDLGKLDPAYLVGANEPLRRAMEIMIQTKTHRVVVVDDNDVPITLITQSRLVALFGTMIDSIPTADRLLSDLRVGFKKVSFVPQNITTLVALRYLQDQDIEGVGVVDKDKGTLLGNLSTDDLKLLGYGYEYWSLLALPVEEYMKQMAALASSLNLRTRFKSPDEVAYVRPNDTFGTALRSLYNYRIHRIYIVDEQNKPIGVISLHDVLAHIWELVSSEEAQ